MSNYVQVTLPRAMVEKSLRGARSHIENIRAFLAKVGTVDDSEVADVRENLAKWEDAERRLATALETERTP